MFMTTSLLSALFHGLDLLPWPGFISSFLLKLDQFKLAKALLSRFVFMPELSCCYAAVPDGNSIKHPWWARGVVCDVEPSTNELCLAASRAPEAVLAPVWHRMVLLNTCQNVLSWLFRRVEALDCLFARLCGRDVACKSNASGQWVGRTGPTVVVTSFSGYYLVQF